MNCPFCGSVRSRVVDSRDSRGGEEIRRRRECEDCMRRFTTYERIDDIPLVVVKKNGTRESFNRGKLIRGVLKATEKRVVSREDVDRIADEMEQMAQKEMSKEISTEDIGNYVMESLKKLDTVAYVRFASVYRDFKDIAEFEAEIQRLRSESSGER